MIARAGVLCFLRIASTVLMFWCSLGIYAWIFERFSNGRIYVVLRVEAMFFGHAADAEACNPPGPGSGLSSSRVVGFYLPSTAESPDRLKEFAAALQEATCRDESASAK